MTYSIRMRKRGNDEETEISFGQELSAKNKIQTTESLAVPVLKYSFGIIHWCQAELQKLDRKKRKLLIIHGHHHPKADAYHWGVPRKQRNRPDAVGRYPHSRNYKNVGICIQ